MRTLNIFVGDFCSKNNRLIRDWQGLDEVFLSGYRYLVFNLTTITSNRLQYPNRRKGERNDLPRSMSLLPTKCESSMGNTESHGVNEVNLWDREPQKPRKSNKSTFESRL